MSLQEEPEAVSILDVLRQHVREKPDGAVLDFVETEQETGVVMDRVGRDALRRACKWEKRPYESIRNCGLRLSSPDNSTAFARNRATTIIRASRRAEKFTTSLLVKHSDTLRDSEKSALLRIASVAASCRLALFHETPLLPPAKEQRPDDDRTRGALQIVRRSKG